MVILRALILLAFLFPALSGAEETSLRIFQLREHQSLQFSAPRSWKDHLHQEPGWPPTIVFAPQEREQFQVQITPMWVNRGAIKGLLEIVVNAAEEAKQAVEPSLPIMEMRGDSGIGYYFSATDRAPKPNDFTYMTKGIFQIGDLAAFFTILSNDDAEIIASAALQMLKGARYIVARAP
jgi:hypothetical protein